MFGPGVERGLNEVFSGVGLNATEVIAGYKGRRPAASHRACLAQCATDLTFRVPTIRLAEAMTSHTSNVYMFQMSWGGTLGAAHGLDVPMMFDTLEASRELAGLLGVVGEDAPQSLAAAMHGAWVSFIKSGSPQHAALPQWPRYDLGRRATMDFNLTSTIVNDPLSEERKLWERASY